MSFQGFPYKFPQGPLVNPASGMHTTDGRNFQLSLFNRTGGSNGIGPNVNTGLIAQGNRQTNALQLGADWNQVDSAAAGTGVQLPMMKPGNDITVVNNTGNSLTVYPFGGAQIDNGAINEPVTLAPGEQRYFQTWTTTQVRTAFHT